MTFKTTSKRATLAGASALVTLALGTAAAWAADGDTAQPAEKPPVIKVIKVHTIGGTPPSTGAFEAKCEGGDPTVDTTSESKDDKGKVTKSRVVICRVGGAGNVTTDMKTRLEIARKAIEEAGGLSEELKARALAALAEEEKKHSGAK